MTMQIQIQKSWNETYCDIETERIRKHLENTEKWMLSKNNSNLSEKLQMKRKQMINLLHEYWKEGNFPLNTQFPQRRLPHIKDEYGTPCAMAYIIEKSGGKKEAELIQLIHENDNNVFIKDVESDSPLIEWINDSGITKEEACQIQPNYAGFPRFPFDPSVIREKGLQRELGLLRETRATDRRSARRRALQIKAKEKTIGKIRQARRITAKRKKRSEQQKRRVTRTFETPFINPRTRKQIEITTKVTRTKRELRQELLSKRLIARRKARAEAFTRKKEARRQAALRKIRSRKIVAKQTGAFL